MFYFCLNPGIYKVLKLSWRWTCLRRYQDFFSDSICQVFFFFFGKDYCYLYRKVHKSGVQIDKLSGRIHPSLHWHPECYSMIENSERPLPQSEGLPLWGSNQTSNLDKWYLVLNVTWMLTSACAVLSNSFIQQLFFIGEIQLYCCKDLQLIHPSFFCSIFHSVTIPRNSFTVSPLGG